MKSELLHATSYAHLVSKDGSVFTDEMRMQYI